MRQEIRPDCPCGGGRSNAACCGPLHEGAAAPDAGALMRSRYSAYVLLVEPVEDGEPWKALMRSRYSAYVLGLEPYLLATWHPDTRPEHLDPGAGPAAGIHKPAGCQAPSACHRLSPGAAPCIST